MSWLRKGKSLVRQSMSSNRISDQHRSRSPPGIIDGRAALDSFKTHWLQAWDIMQRKSSPPGSAAANSQRTMEADITITVDDVTTIVNHIDQMVTFLIQESHGMTSGTGESQSQNGEYMISPLLDYLFMESILDKLLTWSSNVGEFTNAMKLEQLKLYELLVSQLCHQAALFQKPLVRPMLQLLATCGDCAPVEVEKRLVILLNSLCVALSKNLQLLELFFMPKKQGNSYLSPTLDATKNSSPQLRAKLASIDRPESKFIIFSLLIPFVHREGPIGQQARDALLLIMSLSRKHDSVGVYIAENSNFCPVLATGLSGLYSSLPRKLSTEGQIVEDWHQITAEDVQETPELLAFLNSLEFCNAVVQVSHPMVQRQLLEYVVQGFLVSVIGPALHQDTLNVSLETLEKNAKYVNTLDEIIATTAYLELFLRTITEPALLQVFLKFICTESFDGQRVLSTLINRITALSKLGIVTLVLFRTILEINCEDVMLELIFRYLVPCKFLKDRERSVKRLDDLGSLADSANVFLSYLPLSCYTTISNPPMIPVPGHYNLDSLESLNSNLSATTETNSSGSTNIMDESVMAVTFLNNYVEYLSQARAAIYNGFCSTSLWSRPYDSTCVVNKTITAVEPEQTVSSDSGIYMQNNPQSANDRSSPNNQVPSNCSSPTADISSKSDSDQSASSASSDWPSCDQSLIGPFLHNLLVRLENMVNYDFYSNLQLTGVFSLLASYPLPLLRSWLLNCSSLLMVDNVRTLARTLSSLQRNIDGRSKEIQHFAEMQYRARRFMRAREERLLSISTPMRLFTEQQQQSNVQNQRKGSNSSVASTEFIMIDFQKGNRRKSIKELFGFSRGRASLSNASPDAKQLKPVLESFDTGYRYNIQSPSGDCMDADEYDRLTINQRVVLAAIVFEEFLKELSALSQEHYVFETTHFLKN